MGQIITTSPDSKTTIFQYVPDGPPAPRLLKAEYLQDLTPDGSRPFALAFEFPRLMRDQAARRGRELCAPLTEQLREVRAAFVENPACRELQELRQKARDV